MAVTIDHRTRRDMAIVPNQSVVLYIGKSIDNTALAYQCTCIDASMMKDNRTALDSRMPGYMSRREAITVARFPPAASILSWRRIRKYGSLIKPKVTIKIKIGDQTGECRHRYR